MTKRPPSAQPVERTRGERPAGGDWRADAAGRSRHTRLLDVLVRPLEEHDSARAAEICGEICRRALPDLAPALMLLPARERRRTRVLGAFVLTLFDFARQPGLDGDRLAEINRWEFRLEEALDGQPAGQPVFVLMALEQSARPWRREGLDKLLAAARRRALRGAGTTARPAPDRLLAEGLVESLLGAPAPPEARRLVEAVLAAVPGRTGPGVSPAALESRPRGVPRKWRPAARYLQLASRRILVRRQREERRERPRRLLSAQPARRISAGARLVLLLRSRLLG